jgi:hypothetical protein
MGKRKVTIGQTMIYKNKLHKLQRKLKTEKQEQKIETGVAGENHRRS